MTAEHYSASLASRFAIAGIYQPVPGYYRSKLFVVPASTNPLVAAAGPLFSLLERLSMSSTLPEIGEIRNNIEYELNSFHTRIGSSQYTTELFGIAHYLLCATIDELLGKNYLRVYGKPAEFQAFTPSSFDDVGPQNRFFDIVNYIKERTNQYLDLLELAYYCLISGFEGEHHVRTNGRQLLDDTIEELYQLIQQHRVNKPYCLFEKNVTPTEPAIEKKANRFLYFSILALTCCISVIYFGSHALLEQRAKSVLLGHSFFTQTDNE